MARLAMETPGEFLLRVAENFENWSVVDVGTKGTTIEVRAVIAEWLQREGVIIEVESARVQAEWGLSPELAQQHAADTTDAQLALRMAEMLDG
jgi:hypothetical protein